MKRISTVVLMTVGLAAVGLAAEYKGFVEDQACVGKPEMKDDSDCAKKCIKGGSPAMLVTPEGKVYKIANQDKIVASAGEHVTVMGTLKGDTLTVESVK